MRVLRWLAVGCVAMGGLVLAFTAGVWLTKPADPLAGSPPSTNPSTAPTKPAVPPQTAPDTIRPVTPVGGPLPEPTAPQFLPTVTPVSYQKWAEAHPLPVPDVKPVPITPVAEPVPLPLPMVPVVQADKNERPVQYVNKPDLEFEYDIGKKGKSGVKSVSLFVRSPDIPRLGPNEKSGGGPTRDWRSMVNIDVKDETTPKLRYSLPADGRYEFRLGVTSGNGNASTPKGHHPADLTVVLDTTPPAIEEFTAFVDRAAAGLNTPTGWVVDLKWKLTEANPTDRREAVLEYRPAGEGKWHPFADLKVGDDWTSWLVTEDVPAVIAIRLTVTDMAGNVATKTIDKVNLDTTIPEGKLTKVRAVEPGKKELKAEEPLPAPLFEKK